MDRCKVRRRIRSAFKQLPDATRRNEWEFESVWRGESWEIKWGDKFRKFRTVILTHHCDAPLLRLVLTTMSTEQCAACHKGESEATLQLCSGCRDVWYCGAACQRSHRKQHKAHCKKRAAEHKRNAELAKWRDYHPPSPPVACPVCDLPMPLIPIQSVYRACCRAVICHGCDHDARREESPVCPFCGASKTLTIDAPDDPREYHDALKGNVDEGDAIALEQLALDFITRGDAGRSMGCPVPGAIELGIDMLHQAADLGSVGACCRLAMYYKHGHYSCKVNKEKELQYMRKAAAAGCLSIHAQLAAKAGQEEDMELLYHHARIGAEAGDESALDLFEAMYRGDMITEFVTEDEHIEILRMGRAATEALKSESRTRAEG